MEKSDSALIGLNPKRLVSSEALVFLYHIGKQATNMFLVHNFIRVVWYYDFTYSFRYWWLILLVLLAISYVVSIIINALKKTIRYDKIVEALISKCVDGKLKSKEIG